MTELVPLKRRFDLPDMFKDMERMVNRFWHGFPFSEMATTELEGEWVPRLDMIESDEAIEVKADLPGLEAKDIDISLDRDFLVIKGEKTHEQEESGKHYHRVERSYGSFCRSVRLPSEVETKKVDAAFKDGVLTVKLPKSEESKKRIAHIKVH